MTREYNNERRKLYRKLAITALLGVTTIAFTGYSYLAGSHETREQVAARGSRNAINNTSTAGPQGVRDDAANIADTSDARISVSALSVSGARQTGGTPAGAGNIRPRLLTTTQPSATSTGSGATGTRSRTPTGVDGTATALRTSVEGSGSNRAVPFESVRGQPVAINTPPARLQDGVSRQQQDQLASVADLLGFDLYDDLSDTGPQPSETVAAAPQVCQPAPASSAKEDLCVEIKAIAAQLPKGSISLNDGMKTQTGIVNMPVNSVFTYEGTYKDKKTDDAKTWERKVGDTWQTFIPNATGTDVYTEAKCGEFQVRYRVDRDKQSYVSSTRTILVFDFKGTLDVTARDPYTRNTGKDGKFPDPNYIVAPRQKGQKAVEMTATLNLVDGDGNPLKDIDKSRWQAALVQSVRGSLVKEATPSPFPGSDSPSPVDWTDGALTGWTVAFPTWVRGGTSNFPEVNDANPNDLWYDGMKPVSFPNGTGPASIDETDTPGITCSSSYGVYKLKGWLDNGAQHWPVTAPTPANPAPREAEGVDGICYKISKSFADAKFKVWLVATNKDTKQTIAVLQQNWTLNYDNEQPASTTTWKAVVPAAATQPTDNLTNGTLPTPRGSSSNTYVKAESQSIQFVSATKPAK